MAVIAWDIETCPCPTETLSDSLKERHKSEYEYRRKKDQDLPADEVRRKAKSLHPMLGWICCISAVRGTFDDGPRDPYSWTAASEAEEADMLRRFWTDIETMSNKLGRIRWVTCNGKRFDIPFLSARSIKYGITPTNEDILEDHKYRQFPHTDLANVWPNKFYSLEDLCDHLGVDSPKDGFDASEVAPAVEAGEIDRVREYCEGDATATFICAQRVQALL